MEAHTKNELVSEYKCRMNYYKGHEIQRILANTLKCFGFCLMMEQTRTCGQLIPF